MKLVFLIACSKEKRAEAHPAKDLYLSERFRLSRRIAEHYADQWFVVSAKHGIVKPDRVVSPYDISLAALSTRDVVEWNEKVKRQLERCLPKHSHIVCIGASQYFSALPTWDSKRKSSVCIPFQRIDPSNQLAWLRKIQPGGSVVRDVNRLYKILANRTLQESHLRVFGDCTSANWPKRGLYVFYDPRHPRMLVPNSPKIIRVGTHAVSKGSSSSLWQRLKNHRGQINGSGNHRGSIFRLHVGGALLASQRLDCPTWGVGMSAIEDVRLRETDIEKKVSAYLASMQVIALAINDEPSKTSDRAYIEQNMIALLSGSAAPTEIADESWLGYECPNRAVRRACLWNVDYTSLEYDPAFLDVVEEYASITISNTAPPCVPLAPPDWYQRAKSGYRQSGLGLS